MKENTGFDAHIEDQDSVYSACRGSHLVIFPERQTIIHKESDLHKLITMPTAWKQSCWVSQSSKKYQHYGFEVHHRVWLASACTREQTQQTHKVTFRLFRKGSLFTALWLSVCSCLRQHTCSHKLYTK